jgi:excisionase family DNA binding protein
VSDQLAITLPSGLVEQIARRVAELLAPRLAQHDQAQSPWLTLEQACSYLGLSKDGLYKLTAARAIPCRRKDGGQRLIFHRDELDSWIETAYPRLDRLP